MEGLSFFSFTSAVQKLRSATARRPRQYPHSLLWSASPPSSSFAPSSGNAGKLSDDRNISSASTKQSRRAGAGFRVKESSALQLRSSVGGGKQLGIDLDGSADNKVRKVKLKVGGVTCTIHPQRSSSGKGAPCILDASRNITNFAFFFLQKNSGPNQEKQDGFSREAKKDSRGKSAEEGLSGEHTDKAFVQFSTERARKSNQVLNRRLLDGGLDQMEESDEIRYLESLRASKGSPDSSVEHENGGEDVKRQKLSEVSKSKSPSNQVDEICSISHSSKKRLKPGRVCDGTNYAEEEEPVSNVDIETNRKKQKVIVDTPYDVRTKPLTKRQRALQSGKGSAGSSSIEFPDGLPPPPSRRQKKKISEDEKQAKKAEAALRRNLQLEKQDKEMQDVAIRKILGVDSDKKKEEKKQKEQEEKAKAAKLQELTPNTIRWYTGPTGIVVVFPDSLPSIFNSKPCSYPPPREKCAGPSCINPYKYRDSRLNLPLCSLQCYKAVQESTC